MADQYCCINIIRGHSRKISVWDSEQIERERERNTLSINVFTLSTFTLNHSTLPWREQSRLLKESLSHSLFHCLSWFLYKSVSSSLPSLAFHFSYPSYSQTDAHYQHMQKLIKKSLLCCFALFHLPFLSFFYLHFLIHSLSFSSSWLRRPSMTLNWIAQLIGCKLLQPRKGLRKFLSGITFSLSFSLLKCLAFLSIQPSSRTILLHWTSFYLSRLHSLCVESVSVQGLVGI